MAASKYNRSFPAGNYGASVDLASIKVILARINVAMDGTNKIRWISNEVAKTYIEFTGAYYKDPVW